MNTVRDTENILDDIAQERIQQDRKWGIQNHSPMTWIGILAEEFGEAAKEVNEFTFRDKSSGRKAMLRKELIQTAAVAVAMIECLDRSRK